MHKTINGFTNFEPDYFTSTKNNFSNIADKCIYYTDDDNFHFKPYFFVKFANFNIVINVSVPI